MNRAKYTINLTINGIKIRSVFIDSHYKIKHSKSINDELILKLVTLLDDGDFSPDSESNGFSYFVNDLFLDNKKYRLIWLLSRDEIYIGIVNAYRRK